MWKQRSFRLLSGPVGHDVFMNPRALPDGRAVSNERTGLAGGTRSARMTRLSVVGLLLLAVGALTACSSVDAYVPDDVGAPTTAQTSADTENGAVENDAAESAGIEFDDPAVVRFAVAGDVGTGGNTPRRTAAAIDSFEKQREYDALLILGDNVYENGDPADVHDKVLEPFGAVLDGRTRLLAVLGNHDTRDGNGSAQAEALGMPNQWYATEIDNTTIIALDSNQAGNSEQRSWLQETLADTTTQWTIVIMHHPAYSAGWHGSHNGVQTNFVPLFEQYSVDLVLSGHDHDYQRSNTINGITYIVTGAAAKLRETGSEDFTAVSRSIHSFVDLAIYPDRINGRAVDQQGEVFDTFQIPAT